MEIKGKCRMSPLSLWILTQRYTLLYLVDIKSQFSSRFKEHRSHKPKKCERECVNSSFKHEINFQPLFQLNSSTDNFSDWIGRWRYQLSQHLQSKTKKWKQIRVNFEKLKVQKLVDWFQSHQCYKGTWYRSILQDKAAFWKQNDVIMIKFY